MKTKFVIASLAALVAATPALAQDDNSHAFSGPRVEARVGWDDVVQSSNGVSEGKSGVEYGGEVGYDMASHGVVFGAYAGIEGSSTKRCGTLNGSDEICIKAGRNITAGVRVGAVVGQGLLYAKGGYSNGRVNATYTNAALPQANFKDGYNADGWHLGAGYEMNFGHRTYGKVEYVYTDYSNNNTFVTGDFHRHQVMAGVGVRF